MKNLKYFLMVVFLYQGLTIAQTIGSALSSHTIMVDGNGTTKTFGNNINGQLGNGTLTNSNVPVAVTTSGVLFGKTITNVAGGTRHSIVLASDGTVYTFGKNSDGQLGNGTITNSSVPVAVTTSGVLISKTITSVAGGEYHSIALASDGTVYTWGYNGQGQLGNGTNTNSNVPVAVNTSGVLSGKTITSVAGGAYYSIALASDGTVYTWGRNNYGQLGKGNTTNSNVPVAVITSGVLSGKTITDVAGGTNHSIALASDGTVYTWGYNGQGQLGNGTLTNSNVPVAVTTSGVLSGKAITDVAVGTNHSIALASDGAVYTWGDNGQGQLGNGTTTSSILPVAVNTSGVLSGKTITAVAAGIYHSIALAFDGTTYTWGYNAFGQLGNGTLTNSNVPVLVDNSPLPVELTTFTASVKNSEVSLNWETATEVNNYGFDVERKPETGDWKKISFVEGHGNSNSPKHYEFVDNSPSSGKYIYRLKQIDIDGSFEYSKTVEIDFGVPTEFELTQNYPNPFNPSTIIKYSVANVERLGKSFNNVTLKVYDVLGTEVATLVNENQEAGNYKVNFDARDLTSGIYFYTLTSGNFVQTKKMILLR